MLFWRGLGDLGGLSLIPASEWSKFLVNSSGRQGLTARCFAGIDFLNGSS